MPTAFWLFHLWLCLLVALWLACVIKVPAGERKGLLPVGLAVFLLAGVLFGGDWGLARLGLTWRMWPRTVLCVCLWVCGLGAGVLTVRDAGKLFGDRALRRTARGIGAFCLVMVMWFGTVLGGVWALCPGETVGVYHGVTVVQGTWTWVGDTSYELYEYHGALVRGEKSLVSSIEPFLEESP